MSVNILNSAHRHSQIDIDFENITTSQDLSRARNQIVRAVLDGQITDRAAEFLIEQIQLIAKEKGEQERAEIDREIKVDMEEMERHIFPARLATYKTLSANHQELYKHNNPIFQRLLAQHDLEALIKEADRMKFKVFDEAQQAPSNAKTPKSKIGSKSSNTMAQTAAPITIAEQSEASVSSSEYPESVENELPDAATLTMGVFEFKSRKAPVPKSPLEKHEDPRLTARGITEQSFAHIPNKPIPPRVRQW